MEREKQVVALSDIKKYLLKQEIIAVIVILVIVLPFFYSSLFTTHNLVGRILGAICCIMCLYGLGVTICNIRKIQNNTYFKVRTDVLVNKQEDIYSFTHRRNRDRLYFQQGHYDIYPYSRLSANSTWSPIYEMDMQTLYDTAFIDDSFTLIYDRKNILLAFNNKLYEIENDL